MSALGNGGNGGVDHPFIAKLKLVIADSVVQALSHSNPDERVASLLGIAFGFNAAEAGAPYGHVPPDVRERLARAAAAAIEAYGPLP